MAKPEWGTKRVCDSCGAKFYDFHRDPIICPKCDTKFTLATTARSKRNRSARPETVAEATAKAAESNDDVPAEVEDIEDGEEVEGDVDDNALLEDEDDFEEDILEVNAGDDVDEKEC